MTELLFRDDAYRTTATARVTGIVDHCAILVDRSIFYPTGGGQEGDSGRITWNGGEMRVAVARKHEDGVILTGADGTGPLPGMGAEVAQEIDWPERHAKMRLHTCLHLLSVIIPLPVTGGQVTAVKGRLDFDMPEAPEDKQAMEDALNRLIEADHPVSEDWITDDDLAANPGLVKTMSVMPPTGQGRVRLVRIGSADTLIDLQPCGGTHVRSTGEIGPVKLGKIEKKGRQNRRVSVTLATG